MKKEMNVTIGYLLKLLLSTCHMHLQELGLPIETESTLIKLLCKTVLSLDTICRSVALQISVEGIHSNNKNNRGAENSKVSRQNVIHRF